MGIHAIAISEVNVIDLKSGVFCADKLITVINFPKN